MAQTQQTINPANGAMTYTPEADFNGTDTFTYTVTDDGFPTPALTSEATVTVTVNAVNDTPRLTDDTATIDEDNDAVIDVLANDTDVDGNLITETGGSFKLESRQDSTTTHTVEQESGAGGRAHEVVESMRGMRQAFAVTDV